MSRAIFFLLALALVPGPAGAQDSTPVSEAGEWGPRSYVRADAGLLLDRASCGSERPLIQPFWGWRVKRWAAVEIGMAVGGGPGGGCVVMNDLASTGTQAATYPHDDFVAPGIRLALAPTRRGPGDSTTRQIFDPEGNSGARITAALYHIALARTPVFSLGGGAALGLERIGLEHSAISVGMERWWLYPPAEDRRLVGNWAFLVGLQLGLPVVDKGRQRYREGDAR